MTFLSHAFVVKARKKTEKSCYPLYYIDVSNTCLICRWEGECGRVKMHMHVDYGGSHWVSFSTVLSLKKIYLFVFNLGEYVLLSACLHLHQMCSMP